MNKIEFGDCRETMRKWKEQGIKAQTCVTSPPYYGLRDYGHEGQIGLEETPEEYIKAMVEVFRCVWDVLEDDGTLWLNIGDSYYNYRPGQGQRQGKQSIASQKFSEVEVCHKRGLKLDGLKEKDLIGIPWMLAFALRADGWYLRQDIIWHKPNPMPESVQDRCTKAHEYIFLMSKSERYHYDRESIREEIKETTNGKAGVRRSGDSKTRSREHWGVPHNPENVIVEYDEIKGANKRSVWTVTTKPYAGAHFAVFPEELIEPCILAGAPVGAIVLDPFMGSGTTAQVAQDLGRQYLGCELNLEYEALQKKRLSQLSLELA
jgi:DNA modification methylase